MGMGMRMGMVLGWMIFCALRLFCARPNVEHNLLYLHTNTYPLLIRLHLAYSFLFPFILFTTLLLLSIIYHLSSTIYHLLSSFPSSHRFSASPLIRSSAYHTPLSSSLARPHARPPGLRCSTDCSTLNKAGRGNLIASRTRFLRKSFIE